MLQVIASKAYLYSCDLWLHTQQSQKKSVQVHLSIFEECDIQVPGIWIQKSETSSSISFFLSRFQPNNADEINKDASHKEELIVK